jgi:hypothetical protein
MRLKKTATTAALSLTAIGLSALLATAQAATPGQKTKGAGWTLANPQGVTSIGPGPYEIHFSSVDARTKLTPMVRISATHMTQVTGIQFVVTDKITPMAGDGECNPYRTIVMSVEYRPSGTEGNSWGGSCPGSISRSLYSGKVKITSEWWMDSYREKHWGDKSATYIDRMMKNLTAHELGHAVGLGHPNYDRDRDGVVEPYECVRTAMPNDRPTMCSPNGGRQSDLAGRYNLHDMVGLKALVYNYAFR